MSLTRIRVLCIQGKRCLSEASPSVRRWNEAANQLVPLLRRPLKSRAFGGSGHVREFQQGRELLGPEQTGLQAVPELAVAEHGYHVQDAQAARCSVQLLRRMQEPLLKLHETFSTGLMDPSVELLRHAAEVIAETAVSCPLCAADVSKIGKAIDVALCTADMEQLHRLLAQRFCVREAVMPASEIAFTHAYISRTFNSGKHRKMPLRTLVEELLAGLDPSTASELRLDAVFFHGKFRTLNNRRLFCLREVFCRDVRLRILPLVQKHCKATKRFRKSVDEKFFQSNNTIDDGASVLFFDEKFGRPAHSCVH